MRRARTIAVALLLATSGCGWTQWAGGREHRGSTLVAGLSPASVPGWVQHLVSDLAPTGPVVEANGLTFFTRAGQLVAMDPNTDGIVWTADLPSGTTEGGAPGVFLSGASSTVFVTLASATSPFVMGFDVDGARNCNVVLHTCAPLFLGVGSTASAPTPPLVDDSQVIVHRGTTLEAFDATGQEGCVPFGGTSLCLPRWSESVGAVGAGIGPTEANGLVYDVGLDGPTPVLRAFTAADGTLRWTAPLDAPASAAPSVGTNGRIFVPVGATIEVFAGDGCGAPTCSSPFSLSRKNGDPAGDFAATPAFAGSAALATNENGTLSAWPAAGCGGASCQPIFTALVDTPLGAPADYHQAPVVANGVAFMLARRNVAGTTHTFVTARDQVDGHELAGWDLGTASLGPGLTNLSIVRGIVFAPTADAVHAVHAPPVRPLASLSTSTLALTPAFDPGVFDYALRCAAGTNSVTIAMSATAGATVHLVAPTTTTPSASQSPTVPLTPNQAAVIEATDAAGSSVRYWIRCLPPDFPGITATPHPANGTATPGFYLLDNPFSANGAQYDMILDTRGTPVWYRRATNTSVNLTPIGRNTVAAMPNPVPDGFGTDANGHFDVRSLRTNVVVDSIRTVATPTDLHELMTMPDGDHLLLSYPLETGVDLSGLAGTPTPGPNSTIADCVVQQVDPQGNLVWEWRASDHVDPVTETTLARNVTVGGQLVWDVFHCNSVDPKANGNLLVSARHLNAVFEIRRSDGRILWKLGGRPTNKDGAAIIQIQGDPLGGPVQQHDARYLPGDHISLFDNQASQPARGIEYAIDLGTHTAHPVFTYSEPQSQPSCCMGLFRLEPDGHRVIGWGLVTANGHAVTELNASGASVLDISMTPGNGSYRAVKVPPTAFDLDVLRAAAGT